MTNLNTSFDHQDILENLIQFLRNQEEFKDFNFDGSAMRELLRLLAYNSQQQAFQNNFLYNESQHDSAQLRQNMVSLASRLGYTPSSKRAAKIKVNLIVTPSDPQTADPTLTLTRDASFYSAIDGSAFSFSPDKEYIATLSDGKYTFNNVTLLQGTWTLNAFFVNTNGIESYVIPNLNIDTTTLEVFVRTSDTSGDQVLYKEFKTAYDLGSDSKLFFLRENRNGFYEFKFGDNHFSKKLDYGNVITIRYLVTDGDAGNNLSNIVPSTAIGGYYNIELIKIDDKSYGGSIEEDIESIRTLSPLSFASSDSAVTPSDYVAITTKIFSEAGDVISWGGENNDPPKYGYTFLSVKPKNSETLNDSQKEELVNLIKQYNVGTITPIIEDPEYTYINLYSSVKYNPKTLNLTTNALKAKIADRCRFYSKKYMEKFDGSLEMSSLSTFINSIDPCILGNFTSVGYEKRFNPELNFSGSYRIKFGHNLKPGSIKIEGFRVSDANFQNAVYSIVDLEGVLKLQKAVGTQITIMDNDIGSVDYENGVVQIVGFRPNSLIDSYVSIKATPGEGDKSINGTKNVILSVNIVDIVLTVGSPK